MRPCRAPKIPVQRVTVTLTMDCRDDMPEPLLEWMRDELEAHARRGFGADYKPKSVTPAPPARQKRSYQEPPLNFPMSPNITAKISAKRVETPFISQPTFSERPDVGRR